ncbi:hypothetical protein Fot_50482 [Forsythia ovata]|uniref:Uncharacterized protein n=1 Tax=Forsythia ovata TaxID=205694 RepID=A0ABD1PY91_9LAMI
MSKRKPLVQKYKYNYFSWTRKVPRWPSLSPLAYVEALPNIDVHWITVNTQGTTFELYETPVVAQLQSVRGELQAIKPELQPTGLFHNEPELPMVLWLLKVFSEMEGTNQETRQRPLAVDYLSFPSESQILISKFHPSPLDHSEHTRHDFRAI